jgi:subtilisin-like proprotein convertase family protein
MKRTKIPGSLALVILAVLTCNSDRVLAQSNSLIASPATTFTNPAPITIVDDNISSPYPSSITVSGLGTISSTPGSLKVTINSFSHSFPDDVGIVLVGPTGAALILQDGAGEGTAMTGITYTLSDDAAIRLPDLTAWTAGTYKPTTYYTGDSFPAPGPLTTYNNPGPAGSGAATFASTFGGTNANGVWKLYAADFVSGDSGTISGGWSLQITAAPAGDAPIDFNGDSKTDFVVARNTGGGPNGQLTWFWFINGSTSTFGSADWGLNLDTPVSADYDGDGKDDIAIWRPGTDLNAGFYILQSQTGTVRFEQFGQTGDNPTVVADYNGDGKDDVAVYRPGARSIWFYRTIAGGPVNYVPWGTTGDYVAPGDFNGDGTADFGVARNFGGNLIYWRLLSTGATENSNIFGLSSDFIVTGDFDGDGKTDLAVARPSGGVITWYWKASSTGAFSQVNWGLSSDTFAPGDYDGDGKTDVAVFRDGIFYSLSPSSGAATIFQWGSGGDRIPAAFNVH